MDLSSTIVWVVAIGMLIAAVAYRPELETQHAEATPSLPPPGRPAKAALFLDFDGVLHSGTSGTFEYLHAFESLMADFTHVDIVISSTWRKNAPFDYLKSFFSPQFSHRIGGVTPYYDDGAPAAREREIRAYCRQWGIATFVAVDDSADLFSPNCQFLCLTHPSTALNTDAIDTLRSRLAAL